MNESIQNCISYLQEIFWWLWWSLLVIFFQMPTWKASGDFSNPVSKIHLNMKDEIGRMLQAINNMQISMKAMLQSLIANSKEIDTDSQNLLEEGSLL